MNVFIYTLGCKVNEVDSELYAQELRARGARIATDLVDADAVIVNSCSVTGRAQAQSLQFVRRALRQQPDRPVFLTGCGAALLRLTRGDIPAGATLVAMQDRSEVASQVLGVSPTADSGEAWIQASLVRAGRRNRVDVRVQEGCDNMCTYCVVPFVRGTRLSSKTVATAVDEVLGLARLGVHEVVLTGTELGKYRSGDATLTDLVEMLLSALESEGLTCRLRLSSLNPDAITPQFASLYERHSLLCPQLHVPLQSGSDAILERMCRPYTTADLCERVERLRAIDPSFSVTTDLIVGYPGEQEGDADQTLELLRCVRFTKVHIFPYSSRPFTPAAKEVPLPPAVVSLRVHQARDVAAGASIAYAQQFIGRTVRIISEKADEMSAEGYSEYYLWTEATARDGQEAMERDRFYDVAVHNVRHDGERIILSGTAM
jgi:threonylcarbamoyladenosine tRNA methylthiotransferase MtaB